MRVLLHLAEKFGGDGEVVEIERAAEHIGEDENGEGFFRLGAGQLLGRRGFLAGDDFVKLRFGGGGVVGIRIGQDGFGVEGIGGNIFGLGSFTDFVEIAFLGGGDGWVSCGGGCGGSNGCGGRWKGSCAATIRLRSKASAGAGVVIFIRALGRV